MSTQVITDVVVPNNEDVDDDVFLAQGAKGWDGWTPILGLATDADRAILKVTGWAGGVGPEPAAGLFVGADGLTADIVQAISIKGVKGDVPAHSWNGSVVQFQNPDGTPGVAVDLKGPKGDKGIQWKGAWTANTAYAEDDLVTNGGNTYRRKAPGISGSAFDASAWEMAAQGGSTADDSISTAKLKAKAVTAEKAAFLEVGRNLFDPNKAIDGYYVEPTGQIIANAMYGYSDFMPVTVSLPYSGSDQVNGMRKTCYYDANFQVVTGGSTNTITTQNAPTGAVWTRVSYFVARKATFMFEQAAAPSATYEGYTYKGTGFKMDAARVLETDQKLFFSLTERLALAGKLNQSAIKTATMGASPNIFDPSKILTNRFVDRTNGNWITNTDATNWKTAGPYTVKAGQNYRVQGITVTSKAVRFETSTGAYVDVYDINTNGLTVPVPATATQMYVTIARGDENPDLTKIQIALGTQDTAVVPFDPGKKYVTGVDDALLITKLSELLTDDTHLLATLAEKAIWNAKVDPSSIVSEVVAKGRNLCNPSKGTDGYFMENTGVVTASALYGYSDFIPVVSGLPFTGYDGQNNMRKTCFFNAAKQVVAGGSTNNITTFIVPAGVAYVRVTYYLARKATFMFEQAAVPSATYEAYAAGLATLRGIAGSYLPVFSSVTPFLLTIANASKIEVNGCSYGASSYTHRGKSWVNKLSNYTDWMIYNRAIDGQRMIDIADRLRRDTVTYGIKPSTFRPTYVFLGNNGNEYFPNEGENLDLYEEQFKIAVEAVQAIGARPIIGTDYHVNNNKYLESSLKAYADRNKFNYFGIGLNGEKIFNRKPAFWSGSHPGIRSNAHYWLEWQYFLRQLHRPAKAIKIFRPRSTGQTVAGLNYDTIPQRAELWQELNVGERVLNEADGSEAFYDRLDQDTTVDPNDENKVITAYTFQVINNEYAALMNGTAVAFTDFSLLELIIDRVKVDYMVVKVKGDAGLSFHVKNNNDPAKYESVGRDKELVFQVTKAVYDAFTDAPGVMFTSPGVKGGTVQFAYTGKLKSYAMGRGWFLCFTADSDLDQATANRNPATTSITRVSDSSTVATLKLKAPYRYGYTFFAGMNKPKGSFQALTSAEVSYADGTYTISLLNPAKYFREDKLKLIATKAGAFNLTGIEAEYYGGQPKVEYTKEVEQKSFGTELIPTRGFDASWNSTGWSDGGNIRVALPADVRDYPPFLATNAHIELGFDADGFSQKTSRTIDLPGGGTNRRGWQKVTVRVVARLFPKIYNPAQSGEYYTNQPVLSKTSYDLGTLCLGLKAPGSTNPELIIRQPVDVGWSEVTFETTLPIGESQTILELWRDCEVSNQNATWPLQVYDVSFQVS